MNRQESVKEPITVGVLFRYKLLILFVAGLIIFGGYLRIITAPRQFTTTARLAARFSGEAFSMPDLGRTSGLRFPLLEEEVKAYVPQITDPSFIDLVLEDLTPVASQEEPAAEGQDLSPIETLRDQCMKVFQGVNKGINSFLDSALFVKDTIVSERERRVLGVLGGLEVSTGTEASHIVTISYTDKNPEWAAAVANGIALKFIDQQKKRARKRDLPKLEEEVKKAKEAVVNTRKKLFALSTKFQNLSLEDAIKSHFQRLDEIKQRRATAMTAIGLLSKKIMPMYAGMPTAGGTTPEDVARVWVQKLMELYERSARSPEDPVVADIMERIRAQRDADQQRLIEQSREVLKAEVQRLDGEIEVLSNDKRLSEAAPEYSALLVEQTAAQAWVTRAETELLEATQFNVQLDDENVSENVALWQRATVPSFPVQQRPLLKLMVVIVLGLVGGLAAALGRHLVWPKSPPAAVEGTNGDDLDVPIIVLPEQGGETLEPDLEFDMKFPEDDPANRNPRA
jgi:uncharacterized protein involved in exopolysaccharide biosynthesis